MPNRPIITPEDSTYIIGMLESLLEPLKHRTDRTQKELIARPDIADYLVLGFNAVNAALETQVQNNIHTETKQNKSSKGSNRKMENIEMVFVCKADMKSALLSAHFPELVAAASTLVNDEEDGKQSNQVRLIQLPAGSAARLAMSSGLTQLSVFALRRGFLGTTELSARVQSHKIGLVESPGWLRQARLMPTAIATLVTTAPIKFSSKQKQQKQQSKDKPEKESLTGSFKKQKVKSSTTMK